MKKIEISYYDDTVQSFPTVVKYHEKIWEFISFHKDISGDSEYVLMFKEIIVEDISLYNHVSDVQTRYVLGFRCECGALYDRSFANVHSLWCPKWENI